jgi:hypothetical protein
MWPTRRHQVETASRWPRLDEHAPTEVHIDAPTSAELVAWRSPIAAAPASVRSEEPARAPVRAGIHARAA